MCLRTGRRPHPHRRVAEMGAAEDRWDLLWAAQKSQRYHDRRRAYFDRWHTLTTVAGLVAVSASLSTFADLLPKFVSAALALPFFLIAATDLVVNTASMARKHDELRRRFCCLEIDIIKVKNPTPDDVISWSTQRLTIEADEPPIYMVIDLLSENSLQRVYPHLSELPPYPLKFYHRLTAHWFRWPNILDSMDRKPIVARATE